MTAGPFHEYSVVLITSARDRCSEGIVATPTAAELVLALSGHRAELGPTRLAGVLDPGKPEGRCAMAVRVDQQLPRVATSVDAFRLIGIVRNLQHAISDIPVGSSTVGLSLPVCRRFLLTTVVELAMQCPGLLARDARIGDLGWVVLLDLLDDGVATEHSEPLRALAPFGGQRGLAPDGAGLAWRLNELAVVGQQLDEAGDLGDDGPVIRGTSHETSFLSVDVT